MKQREKYNIFTAIAMVVGSVIGSGVFFKAETVVKLTDGNFAYGIGAWVLGGTSMIFCLLSFGIISAFVQGEADLLGITLETAGKRYSYFAGWFMETLYYPSLTAVLSWLCADYTLQSAGIEDSGGLCPTLSGVFLAVSFAQNTLFPKASGKVQIITTVLKLIPLTTMILLGAGRGVLSGFGGNFSSGKELTNGMFPSVSAVMFAYEGWIAALCIGPELKNSEKNLPKALIIGGTVVLFVYILYYAGILGAISSDELISYGKEGIKKAFSNVVGERLSGLLLGFAAISCYGALNGMMFSLGRSMHSLACRNMGPCPKLFSKTSEKTSMPVASFSIGLAFAFLWLFFLYGSRIASPTKFRGFGFDISEIPVVTVYAMYIPIFVCALKKWGSKLNFVKRGIIILGIVSCIFTAISALITHIKDMDDYLFAFTVIMLIGEIFRKNSE